MSNWKHVSLSVTKSLLITLLLLGNGIAANLDSALANPAREVSDSSDNVFDMLGATESELRERFTPLECHRSDGLRMCEYYPSENRKQVYGLKGGNVVSASETVFSPSPDEAYSAFQTLSAGIERLAGPPDMNGQVGETGSLNRAWNLGDQMIYLRAVRNNSSGLYTVTLMVSLTN